MTSRTITTADGRPLHAVDVSVLGADGHLWLSVHANQGSVFGIPRTMPSWAAIEGQEPIDWLTATVHQARTDAGAAALGVGRALTELVFGEPDVVALLQQARGAANNDGAQLLVRILAAPQQVSAWPWELLLDPQAPERFLTLARDVHVVRAGRARTYPVRQQPIDPPLNLLMVMSSPMPRYGSAPGDSDVFDADGEEASFDLYEEKRALRAELQPLVDKGLLYVEVEDRPTKERLRSRIGRQRRGFHLFHYLGHARPDGLKLEDRNGFGRLVPSRSFATLLQQMPDLRLAVFAGCETARAPRDPLRPGTWPGPMSLADFCVRDAAPMVVGMQAVLPFGTERLFTRFFYQALTGGQPVAEALRLARLAIQDDDFAGGELLNWAVPCLFVGGSLPGPVANPDVIAMPRPQPRRIGLRLGIRQGELRFISHLVGLRQAIDVLSGQTGERLLHVIGPHDSGKTAFLDRAVEELAPEVVLLFVDASRLLQRPDPLLMLCRLVGERLREAGLRPTEQNDFTPMDWWERLLDDLKDLPLALVIDDGDDLLADQRGADVLDAITRLTDRRGKTRVAVSATSEISSLTGSLPDGRVRKVHLTPLSWNDVWRWIRRNLPVLTRFSKGTLEPFYYDLTRLEDWERLADEVVSIPTFTDADLPVAVRRVSRSRVTTPGPAPSGQGGPTFSAPGDRPSARAGAGAASTAAPRPAEPGALRLAVAGTHTEGREEQVTRSITSFAAEHGVSGRVVTGDGSGPATSLARLLSVPTPFATGAATAAAIHEWLSRVIEQRADLVVLDYGSATEDRRQRDLIEQLLAAGALVVAAGGNDRRREYPAAQPGVLAVGALDEDGRPTAYSAYLPDLRKPEVYAPARLRNTSLAPLLENPDQEGTSMAALYAAAAAVVVWASDRGLGGPDVRRILIEAAADVPDHPGVRRLDVDAALAATRRQLILDALQSDALELGQLLAETGLPPETAVPVLDELTRAAGDQQPRLVRTLRDGVERYEDPDALHLAYARLRQQPAGGERTAQLQALVNRAADLARRGRYSSAAVAALWASGHDGRRVVALGAVQSRPELGTPAMLRDAITASRSAFEQYQALCAARAMADGDRLDDEARAQLHDLVAEALADATIPAEGGRRAEARALLTQLA